MSIPAVVLDESALQKETGGTTFEPINSERNYTPHDDLSGKAPSINEHQDFNGGVNIQRAEADFAELSKQLTRTSNISRQISRVQSHQSRKNDELKDVEKGGLDGSEISTHEPFDLEKTLRGSRDEEEAAGIKSKHIGVVWEDLTVSGKRLDAYF